MDFQPIKKFALVSLSAFVLAACESTPTTDGEFDSTGTSSSSSTQSAGSTVDSSGAANSGVSGSAVSGSSVSSSAENALAEAKDAAMNALTVFYFDFDKSDVSAEAMDALKAHAVYLTANTDAKVNLAGHADERGTREYNLALGERRGKAVASVLLAEGVAPSQIEVISYGEEKPAVLGTSEADMAKNRRVELSY
jgi:peptidoglycan-associated lipoprotein